MIFWQNYIFVTRACAQADGLFCQLLCDLYTRSCVEYIFNRRACAEVVVASSFDYLMFSFFVATLKKHVFYQCNMNGLYYGEIWGAPKCRPGGICPAFSSVLRNENRKKCGSILDSKTWNATKTDDLPQPVLFRWDCISRFSTTKTAKSSVVKKIWHFI